MTTIRQLRFLVAVANELNFSRAAEKCHVTQPTLSAGLKELETQLGAMIKPEAQLPEREALCMKA